MGGEVRAVAPERHPLHGACGRSGGCCEAPAVGAGPAVWSIPGVRRLFLAWQRRVNGFELGSADADSGVFVFRCSHFHRATRSCDSYDSRPGMCRDYPRNLMWQPNPELLPACGYRARPPNAAGLRAALEKADLTPEQREALRKGLRLDG
jgi:Fe-S-cluster containining protein